MLDELHQILQIAFDWFDGHLHEFAAGHDLYHPATERFLSNYAVEDGEEGVPEAEVRLDEVMRGPGDKLFYLYDFGDDWEHVIKLEAVIPREAAAPRATCTKGRRSSPPEDCGGIWGYELAVAANDPASPRHREARDVFAESYGPDFDPSELGPIPFDIDSINAALHESFR